MYGLRRRAWWGLAAFAVLILLFGAGDIFLGAGPGPIQASPGASRGELLPSSRRRVPRHTGCSTAPREPKH